MKQLYPLVFTIAPFVLSACSDGSDRRPATPPPEVALCTGTEVNPERLFLQQLGPDRAIIKWRGNLDGGEEASQVCFGTDMNALPQDSLTEAEVTATGHSEALLTGLQADTTYYYSVGGAGTGSQARSFRTAPETGSIPADGNTRIWIVGDSGVASDGDDGAEHVRDGYLNWVADNGGEAADLFLMLGDNAYLDGTDAEHQVAVFDLYTETLATTGLWTTIGNHEMGSYGGSRSADSDSYEPGGDGEPDPAPDSPMPYLNIHTLPTQGESGGVASGTEQYYSLDYGNVHIVSLDSQLAARDEASRSAMLDWLKDDLMANSNDWTIVIFHHPPYTKGSHNSDRPMGGLDQPIFDMREEFTPVFDDYGVDLVYSGHSHSFERSYYIGGHTGLSNTFNATEHAELNDDGLPANGQGDEAYTQITRNGTDDKVVYTVAGSSGKATRLSRGFPHPAHFTGGLILGSVVLDVGASSLQARFIDPDGQVVDSFTMSR